MTGLRRTLTRGDIIFAVIGNVIGSGIFLVPAETLRVAGGSTTAALMVWVLGGLLCLLGALTYAELGAANPEAGGIYCYIRDAFGALPAFLYGWVLFLIIGPATVAALAVASVAYLGQLVNLGPAGGRVAAVAMILVIGAINVAGARESANVQNASAGLKAAALVVLSGILIALGRWGVFESVPGAPTPSLFGGVGAAMVGVLWAYEGWQWVTFSAGETKDPQRSFPAGLVIGTAALIALYVVVNIAYFMALGPAAAASSTSIAADAVAATVGLGWGKAVAAVVVLATFSAAHGSVLTVPRVFYQMAHDGLFFRRLAEVHPRFGTPAWAVLSTTLLSAIYALSGTFDQLLTAVVFTAWVFYGLGAMAIFVFRTRLPGAPRPFRVPGYPVTPALFVGASIAVVVNTLFTQPIVSAVGTGVLLAGVPAFYFWRRRTPLQPPAP
ncbi:MAG: amino acid permease [Gemmatimonadota bacterium]|nr:amino acid permease [Gemmatimonadota bacterium]